MNNLMLGFLSRMWLCYGPWEKRMEIYSCGLAACVLSVSVRTAHVHETRIRWKEVVSKL